MLRVMLMGWYDEMMMASVERVGYCGAGRS